MNSSDVSRLGYAGFDFTGSNYYTSGPGLLYIIIAILSTVFNLLYIVISLKRKHENINTLSITVTLSISNIVEAYSMVLQSVVIGLSGNAFTPWSASLPIFAGTWQSLLILIVAVDCFMAIIKPLHYPIIVTKRRVIISLIFSCIISSVYPMIMIIYTTIVPASTVSNSTHVITMNDLYSQDVDVYYKIWFIYRTVISVLASLIYIPVLKSVIYQLKHQNRERTGSYRGFVITTALLVYYILSFLPMNIVFLTPYIRNQPLISAPLQTSFFLCAVMSYSSCIINPFLYGLASKAFWRDVYLICIRRPETSNQVRVA